MPAAIDNLTLRKNSLFDNSDRTKRSWKPNVQDKQLFSYILDRPIRLKVTTHALRCIDKLGGIDEYLLKTPYHNIDSERGLFWKAKIEKLYAELGEMEVYFFSPKEAEANLEDEFEDLKLEQKVSRREARRRMYGWTGKSQKTDKEPADADVAHQEAATHEEGTSDADIHEPRIAHG